MRARQISFGQHTDELDLFGVPSSDAVCRKDIALIINGLVFLFFITMPPTKVPRAISSLEIKEEQPTPHRQGIKHPATSLPLWAPGRLSLRASNIRPFTQLWRIIGAPPTTGRRASAVTSIMAAITLSKPPLAARCDSRRCPMRREGLDARQRHMAPATVPANITWHLLWCPPR
ncbi:hypothetical protein ACLOJK_022924 [Asimina triloba]